MIQKGVYVLILKLDQESDIQIGKLGKLHFRKGFYAYTGSALGSGGFKRVERHFNVSKGINPTRKWHIDYILPKSRIVHTILIPTEDTIECKLARRIRKISGISIIPGFGCTDCMCETHLIYFQEELKNMIIYACNNIGIKNMIINSSNQEGGQLIPFGYKMYILPCPECRSANSMVYNIFADYWTCKNCGYTIYSGCFDDEK